MIKSIMFFILVSSLNSFSQSLSPAPANNEFDMSNGRAINLTLGNRSGSNQNINLSLGNGFSFLINRCPLVLANNKTCSLTISVNPALLSVGDNIVSLNNGSTSLVNLKYTKAGSAITSSLSISANSLNFGTLSRVGNSIPQNITITNTGNVSLVPIISLSNKLSLVLNRCSGSLAPTKTCQIGVSVSPTTDMANGAILNQSLVIKKDVSDVGQLINVSASLNIVLSCSGLQHQENGLCVSNQRSCLVQNGSGTQSWSSGIWGTCNISSCNAGYFIEDGACTIKHNKISTGVLSSCAIKDSKVYCWGAGNIGQRGQGLSSSTGTPSLISPNGLVNGKNAVALTDGAYFTTAALNTDGEIVTWGLKHRAGNFGNGPVGSDSIATQQLTSSLPNGETVKSLPKNKRLHIGVISNTDSVYAWGLNNQAQISDSFVNQTTPDLFGPNGLKAKIIETDIDRICVVSMTDQLFCQGRYSGFFDYGFVSINISSMNGEKIKTLASSKVGGGIYVISDSGKSFILPFQSSTLSSDLGFPLAKELAVSATHMCLIDVNDKLFCKGSNQYGQLGIGTTTSSSTFVEVTALSSLKVKEVSVSDIGTDNNTPLHTCAKTLNNQIYCWGSNSQGQIGNGNIGTNVLTPSLVNIP